MIKGIKVILCAVGAFATALQFTGCGTDKEKTIVNNLVFKQNEHPSTGYGIAVKTAGSFVSIIPHPVQDVKQNDSVMFVKANDGTSKYYKINFTESSSQLTDITEQQYTNSLAACSDCKDVEVPDKS